MSSAKRENDLFNNAGERFSAVQLRSGIYPFSYQSVSIRQIAEKHRARTRCSGGAFPEQKPGTTAFRIALEQTGRVGKRRISGVPKEPVGEPLLSLEQHGYRDQTYVSAQLKAGDRGGTGETGDHRKILVSPGNMRRIFRYPIIFVCFSDV